MRCELTYWANHNDLLGDHHGWCTYYIASIFGKYVSFLTASAFEMKGVISSVIFQYGWYCRVFLRLGWILFVYWGSKFENSRRCSSSLISPWYIYEISGNPWSVSVSGFFSTKDYCYNLWFLLLRWQGRTRKRRRKRTNELNEWGSGRD